MRTSVSKEFEHLKQMNDEAISTDLETQLQLLEQQDTEDHPGDSTGDLSSTTVCECTG